MNRHNVTSMLCAGVGLCLAVGVLAADVEDASQVLTLQAQCALPFQDNAVLQQQLALPVWGTSLPGAKVTVRFDAQSKTTTADSDGNWRVVLDPMTAVKLASVNDCPPGQTLTVVCEKDGERAVREFQNLLVGEVWLGAGQSNMAGKMGSAGRASHFPTNSIAQADYPALRQFVSPQDGPWLICSPETASNFKKVCFFFARGVQRDILVPVGIINAAVGGSKIETWLNRKPYAQGGNYTKLVQPLAGYGLRGALWYQGESNAGDKRGYQPKLESLITGWRAAWGQGDFPVYFVQLPGIGTSSADDPACGDGRAEIREAQFRVLAVTNTGMAVTIDVGAVREHPPNKYDTGERLARLALHNDYGFTDLVPTGPLYKGCSIEGDAIRVTFDHAEHGLMVAVKDGFLPPQEAPDAKLSWLSIQDKDGAWHWAEGRIDGSELVVSCKDVKEPVAVRYGYTNHPVGALLYNRDGLPAGPFTTGGYGTEEHVED